MSEQELNLVNKVELRIALADTDKKFESSLDLYLCPLLLKLASIHTEVRQEILKFIQQLIPRIQSSSEIKLPTAKLVQQAKNPKIDDGVNISSVQLYSLLFASKGVDRLTLDDKKELLPIVVEGIHQFGNTGVGARLFHIFCKLLQGWKFPKRGTDDFKKLKETLHIDSKDGVYLLAKIEKIFLLAPVINQDGAISGNYTCPGSSSRDISYLTHDAGVSYKNDDLANVKINISSFLPVFHDEGLIPVLLIGVCDSNETVSNSCASLYRKVTVPFENSKLINHLISLFVGDDAVPISPVKPPVQERIINVLNSSKIATKSPYVSTITSIGLDGSIFPKLESATIQFIRWVALNAGDEILSNKFADYSVNVAAQLKDNLHVEGWPKLQTSRGSRYASNIRHRQLQYEALGDILKRNFNLTENLSYIEFLFDSLLGDLPAVRTTIQESLSSLVIHLPNFSTETKTKLRESLAPYLQNDDFSNEGMDAVNAVRYVAIKFINVAFPFEDQEARMLNILGSSTKNRSDVIEEAQKGLHPYWFNILQSSNTTDFKATHELLGVGNTVQFPSFASVVKTLVQQINYSKDRECATLRYSMVPAVEFALHVLVTQAAGSKSTVIVQDQEWITRLEKGLEHDDKVITAIKKELVEVEGLNDFLGLLLDEFAGEDSNGKDIAISKSSSPVFGKIFLNLISFSPQTTIEHLIPQLSRLNLIIKNHKITREDTIRYAANSIGIIASHPANSDENVLKFYKDILGFWGTIDTKHMVNHGRLLVLGFLTSRLYLRGRTILTNDVIKTVYGVLADAVASNDTRLSGAATTVISQLAQYGGFGPELTNEDVETYKKQIIESLQAKVKKVDEKAIIAWTLLSLSEPESTSEEFTDYEQTLYETHTTKQTESLFTSGEAFSIIASGWGSKFLQKQLDIQSDDLKTRTAPRNERLNFILSKILQASASTKPSLRKASCIWLLSLVQYCGHLPIIEEKSGAIHVTFMRFLADRDELVQEAASRGLNMIYELGDADLKETLVKSLLRSFTESTSSAKLGAGTVSEDTELFEPGVLKTGDGSVSTYKDILNLASEVGDPSLVYKFMSLAKSSALWSSRKGIAFGLGSIISKSSLDKLLFENASLSNRLIPKLYRYKFDPNPTVAKSMNDIWSTIVHDSSKTIDEYHESILKELLTGMGNKEWRVREASTVALTDLLHALNKERYQDQMEEIWTMGFRAIDDIKDSVRKAGGGLTRALSQMLVNSIKVETGSSEAHAKEVLDKLLPFLLGTKGIQSDAEDVRDFALDTILKLVKKGGKAIKPFIAELIDQFVLLMSTLEPQVINYLALNADKYNLKHDDIDSKRLQNVGSSPMMNALERLVDLIDEDILDEVISKLQSTVKKAVGLPSKAAASRLFVTLAIRHLQMLKPYGDRLLNICISQLDDRNTTVSSSFATAAGYVCRVCSVDTVARFAEKIQKSYFETEDEKSKIIAGVACEAVSKYSGDKFASVATAFLPVAFIAKNDAIKEVSKNFENLWAENTSGKGAVRLYIHEICDLVKQHIGSPQFSIRQTAAKSIAEACNAIDGATGIGTNADDLFEVLMNACQGRSWNGKEDVLQALVSLCSKSKTYVDSRPELLAKVKMIVITEAKRRNKEYQIHAIVSLGEFASVYPSEELHDNVIEIFEPLLSDEYYESEDEDEDLEKDENKTVNVKSSPKNLIREAQRIKALSSLVKSFQLYGDKSYHARLLKFILEAFEGTIYSNIIIPTWRSQIAVVEGLGKISTVLKGATKIDSENVDFFIKAWGNVFKNNTKSEDVANVKIQTVKAGKCLIEIDNEKIKSTVIGDLKKLTDDESSSVVKQEIVNALGIN